MVSFKNLPQAIKHAPKLVFEMLDYTSSFLFFRDNNPSTVLMLVTVCQIENGETSRLLKSVKLV